jgi:hypothetical protein
MIRLVVGMFGVAAIAEAHHSVSLLILVLAMIPFLLLVLSAIPKLVK